MGQEKAPTQALAELAAIQSQAAEAGVAVPGTNGTSADAAPVSAPNATVVHAGEPSIPETPSAQLQPTHQETPLVATPPAELPVPEPSVEAPEVELSVPGQGLPMDDDTPSPEVPASDDPLQLQSQVAELTAQLQESNQRFTSLQGRLDSQHGPMVDELRETRERLAQTEAELQRAQVTSQEELSEEQLQALYNLSPELAGYPPETIQLIRRIVQVDAANLVEGQINTLVNEHLAPAEEKLARQQHEVFITALTTAVPDCRTVNASKGWLSWLGEHEPMLGKTRDAALLEAYEAQDAPRVIAFFKDYASTHNGASHVAPGTSVADQAMPRPAAAPVQSSGPAQRPSIEHVERLAENISKGRIKGAENIAAAKAELHQAYR